MLIYIDYKCSLCVIFQYKVTMCILIERVCSNLLPIVGFDFAVIVRSKQRNM